MISLATSELDFESILQFYAILFEELIIMDPKKISNTNHPTIPDEPKYRNMRLP
jgi:hypothetical protein